MFCGEMKARLSGWTRDRLPSRLREGLGVGLRRMGRMRDPTGRVPTPDPSRKREGNWSASPRRAVAFRDHTHQLALGVAVIGDAVMLHRAVVPDRQRARPPFEADDVFG